MTNIIGQKTEIPANALATFEKEYNANNDATDIVWSKANLGIKVYYEYNSKKRVILFDEAGNFKENRIYISENRLNAAASDYIKLNYSKHTIVQCYEVLSNTAPERNEVEIEIDGNMSTLYFRPNGEFHYQK
jgi:hypothetical protein